MTNPLQQQLLKAGLVTEDQVNKLNKDKSKNKPQKRSKKQKALDENKLKSQKVESEKAKLDRELNKKKEEEARKKAISAEIDQLITTNRIERGEECEIAYNFEHLRKVKRIYINADMKQQIIQGQLGIARIVGRYELIPRPIAEKIQQRNPRRVILIEDKEQIVDENDPYAAYQIPDDLTW